MCYLSFGKLSSFCLRGVFWAILKDFEFASTFTVPLNGGTRVESIISYLKGTSAGAIFTRKSHRSAFKPGSRKLQRFMLLLHLPMEIPSILTFERLGVFEFFSKASSDLLHGFSIGKVLREAWIFLGELFAHGLKAERCGFLVENRSVPFKKLIPSLSSY